MRAQLRPALIATVYGALAGALAAVTLWLMNQVSAVVWSVSDARCRWCAFRATTNWCTRWNTA